MSDINGWIGKFAKEKKSCKIEEGYKISLINSNYSMLHADNDLDLLSTKPLAFMNKIENLKLDKMLDTLGQAWQSGSALAASAPGRTAVNKYRLCGSL